MTDSVLLDTSFLIRLLNDGDHLHKNARDYFKYFLDEDISLVLSTISIAEYCVRGSVNELPLHNFKILPFNFDHAQKAGAFSAIIFEERKKSNLDLNPRQIIPNDTKLFAQADVESRINFFITSDARSLTIHNLLKKNTILRFEIIDINNPVNCTFGILDF